MFIVQICKKERTLNFHKHPVDLILLCSIVSYFRNGADGTFSFPYFVPKNLGLQHNQGGSGVWRLFYYLLPKYGSV